MASFQDLLTGPGGTDVASAWSDIQNQIEAEGGSGLALQSAQDTLAETFSQLTTSQFGVDPTDALAYATKFTMTAQTVVGAVDTVSTLIRAGQGAATPAESIAVVNQVVGTMVSVAIATGVVASGIGALIVAAVSVTFELLQAAGLLGQAPVARQCGVDLSFTPSLVVGCAGSRNAVKNQPNSPAWRRFPDPSTPWFKDNRPPASSLPIGGAGAGGFQVASFDWTDASWYALLGTAHRPIDAAFPDYALLEAGLTRPLGPVALAASGGTSRLLNAFRSAYFVAWKGNQEFEFNGLTPQPDWVVLVQVARIWNRAHAGGVTFDVGPGELWDPSYVALTDLAHVGGADPVVGGKLRLSLGPQIAPTVLPNTAAVLAGSRGTVATPPAAGASSSSGAGPVVAAVAAGSVLAGAAWLAAGGRPADAVAWVKGLFR